MTVGARSYGTAAGVAVLVPRYANASVAFDTTTKPTLATVESLIDQVSGLANSLIASAGFTTPIIQADAVLALTIFIQEEVAAIAEGINGSGRFGPTTKEPGRSRFTLIMDDLKAFIDANTQGWAKLGVVWEATTGTVTAGVISLDFADHNETVY